MSFYISIIQDFTIRKQFGVQDFTIMKKFGGSDSPGGGGNLFSAKPSENFGKSFSENFSEAPTTLPATTYFYDMETLCEEKAGGEPPAIEPGEGLTVPLTAVGEGDCPVTSDED